MSRREVEDGMGFAGHDPAMTPEERHIERLERELRRKQDEAAALKAQLREALQYIGECPHHVFKDPKAVVAFYERATVAVRP